MLGEKKTYMQIFYLDGRHIFIVIPHTFQYLKDVTGMILNLSFKRCTLVLGVQTP